jgi:SAM-dependent methyltransferase
MSSTQGIQAEAPTAVFGPVTADIYERQMGRWSQRLAEPFLDFVAANLHGAAALDVGCGTGSLSFAMARRDPTASITGCDISEALLAHGRAANPYPERVRFKPGNACALRFADSSFDLVVSSLVLMFVPDAELAAAEMARVAKPRGVVATATWDLRGGMMRISYDTIVPSACRERRAGEPVRWAVLGSALASSRRCGARPVCAMCGKGKSPSAWISPISPTIGIPRSRAQYCPAFSMGYPPSGTSVFVVLSRVLSWLVTRMGHARSPRRRGSSRECAEIRSGTTNRARIGLAPGRISAGVQS